MFRFVTQKEQLLEERKKREALTAQLEKAQGDMDYIAMMSDIDLDQEDEENE